MSENRHIYVIEAYGYDDRETHILSHKEDMSDEKFLEIVKKAQKMSTKYERYGYSQNVLECLVNDFGFEHFHYPCVDIGCSVKSDVESFKD